MVSSSLSIAQPLSLGSQLRTPCRLSVNPRAKLRLRQTCIVPVVLKSSCKICALKSRWQRTLPFEKSSTAKRKITSAAVTAKSWDHTTSRCVELSTVAFIFLLLPQVIKNYLSMSSGNSEALAVLSWVVSNDQCLFKDGMSFRFHLCGTAGLPDVPLWERAFAGLLCGQTGRRSHCSASHRCHRQFCHAYTGAYDCTPAALSLSISHCLLPLDKFVCISYSLTYPGSAADLAGKSDAISCISAPDCPHGVSRGGECMQVLWCPQH